MIRKAILLVLCMLYQSLIFAQQVSNTRFEQDGKQVKIYYDLSETADVSIYLSTDGGRSYGSSPIGHVSGHVGRQVAAGKNRCAVWDVLSDRDKLQGGQICFKIRAVRQGANQTFTVGGVNFTMVYVAGGTFMMGCTPEQGSDCWEDGTPAHRVTLSDYYIGETEVTQALWNAVMGNNPSKWKGDNLAVENVSWEDSQIFLLKLNHMTGRSFRLPTEAEFEYAARGGNKSLGYKYSGSNNIFDVAWWGDNCMTHAVKTKLANELGLYDMSGNVREWCSDWYHDRYSNLSQTNPEGPSTGAKRVLRGGLNCGMEEYCRVSFRGCNAPSERYNYNGLRLVLCP